MTHSLTIELPEVVYQSLREEAAQKGKGRRYIHSLFEDTLMGWRSQAYRRSTKSGSLAHALNGVFDYKKVVPDYVEQARKLGHTKSPQELWQTLLNFPAQKWREAPMHGDMHGNNVRVRNNDAIIIDLANTAIGPLCADLASLDVWFSFELPGKEQTIPARDTWTKAVTELYSLEQVTRLRKVESVDVGLEWLRGCIRQIRMISGAICECETEYPTAVAIYLLRRATYAAGNEEDEYRRVYAYWLGAMLVEDLTRQFDSAVVT